MGETNVTDRRVERANRTRDNVVDALLDLIDEGNLRPTAREIAARANVSLRSLYVHFDDVEALFYAAAIRADARMEGHRTELLSSGPFEERLASLVDRKAVVFEVGRNIGRAALVQEPFSPALHSILETGRRCARADIDKVFGPELTGPDATQTRAALDAMTNPITWEVLRHQHGLDVDAAKSVMSSMVRAFLGKAPQ